MAITRKWIQSATIATDVNGALVTVPTSPGPVSSGLTAKATANDTAVLVIAANTAKVFHHFRIFNGGNVAGFYSIDGGTTWCYLPANYCLTDDGVEIDNKDIKIQRVAGGSNMTGVYAQAW